MKDFVERRNGSLIPGKSGQGKGHGHGHGRDGEDRRGGRFLDQRTVDWGWHVGRIGGTLGRGLSEDGRREREGVS